MKNILSQYDLTIPKVSSRLSIIVNRWTMKNITVDTCSNKVSLRAKAGRDQKQRLFIERINDLASKGCGFDIFSERVLFSNITHLNLCDFQFHVCSQTH